MAFDNQDYWNERWEKQLDAAHADLLKLLTERAETADRLEKLDAEVLAQLGLMELVAAQIRPKEP